MVWGGGWLRFPVLPVLELLEMRQKLYFRISVPGPRWNLDTQMYTKRGHVCTQSPTQTRRYPQRSIIQTHKIIYLIYLKHTHNTCQLNKWSQIPKRFIKAFQSFKTEQNNNLIWGKRFSSLLFDADWPNRARGKKKETKKPTAHKCNPLKPGAVVAWYDAFNTFRLCPRPPTHLPKSIVLTWILCIPTAVWQALHLRAKMSTGSGILHGGRCSPEVSICVEFGKGAQEDNESGRRQMQTRKLGDVSVSLQVSGCQRRSVTTWFCYHAGYCPSRAAPQTRASSQALAFVRTLSQQVINGRCKQEGPVEHVEGMLERESQTFQ